MNLLLHNILFKLFGFRKRIISNKIRIETQNIETHYTLPINKDEVVFNLMAYTDIWYFIWIRKEHIVEYRPQLRIKVKKN